MPQASAVGLTDGDVSGSTKDKVDQHWIEGGVQAKHRS